MRHVSRLSDIGNSNFVHTGVVYLCLDAKAAEGSFKIRALMWQAKLFSMNRFCYDKIYIRLILVSYLEFAEKRKLKKHCFMLLMLMTVMRYAVISG